MSYLLDTHSFLWFIGGNSQLSQRARTVIEKEDTHLYLSIASLWEMAIKISLGKLHLSEPFEPFISAQLFENDIELLQISLPHTSLVVDLPFHHRDPFDRLLIAQTKTEDIAIISADKAFDAYGIERIW